MGCHGTHGIGSVVHQVPARQCEARVPRWKCLPCLSRPALRVHLLAQMVESIQSCRSTNQHTASLYLTLQRPRMALLGANGYHNIVTGGLLWIIGGDTTLMATQDAIGSALDYSSQGPPTRTSINLYFQEQGSGSVLDTGCISGNIFKLPPCMATHAVGYCYLGTEPVLAMRLLVALAPCVGANNG